MVKKKTKKATKPKVRSRKASKVRKKAEKPMSRSLRVYQKVAIVFVIISLLLLLGVLYLSVSHAVIRVTPNPQVVSSTSSVEVTQNPNALGEVTGYVVQGTYEKAQEFQVPESGGVPVEAKAHGTVTMINETSTQVDLVATTRLLSEEGVLFRLDDAVSIPPNAQIEAKASADQPGLSGEIGPTQFTIPGLPADSQQVVYAVSVDSMIGGVEYRKTVTQADLDQAVSDLSEQIVEESKEVLRSGISLDTFDGEEYSVEVITKESDTEPGTEAGSFGISVTAEVTAVFYDQKLITDFAESELFNRVPQGYELATINSEGLQIDVQNVNPVDQSATLSVYLDGLSVISTNSDLLAVERFIGTPPSEVEEILEGSDAIQSVEVSFTPFWLKRIPTLEDHIKIVIEPIE